MRTRVIVKTDRATGKVVGFWTGTRWTTEYPDAQKYGTTNQAIREWTRVPGEVKVIAGYGDADQETEWAA